MPRSGRLAKQAPRTPPTDQGTQFLRLLAENLLKAGVPVTEADVAKSRQAIKDSILLLPDTASFKPKLVKDIDSHVDFVLRRVVDEGAEQQGLGRYPRAGHNHRIIPQFNLLLENGLADALTTAKGLPAPQRRQRYRLLLSSAPNSDIAAKVANDFFDFESAEDGPAGSVPTLLQSVELMCAEKWTPMALCTWASIFYKHYGPLVDAAAEASAKKKLMDLFATYRGFLARASLYIKLMEQPLNDWPAKWLNQYFSLMAAILAQYADILLVMENGHAEATRAASQLAAVAMHFLALSFEHLLDLLLSLSPIGQGASNECLDSMVHLYSCVLARGRRLDQQLFADASIYGKFLLGARRAQLLAGRLLQDTPAIDEVLRECVMLPMPASFPHRVPDMAKHVKGKPGTESFDSQLSRYILYKATEDEVDKAVAQLTAGAVRDSSDGDHDDGTTFFIDATGMGEVGEARRQESRAEGAAEANKDMEAELQAEIDAMLAGMSKGDDESGGESDDSGDDDREDALRYSPGAGTEADGAILQMLDKPGADDLVGEGDEEQSEAPATRSRRGKRQEEDAPAVPQKRTRAARS